MNSGKKNSRTGLWILIGVLCAAVLIGALYFGLRSGKDKKEEAASKAAVSEEKDEKESSKKNSSQSVEEASESDEKAASEPEEEKPDDEADSLVRILDETSDTIDEAIESLTSDDYEEQLQIIQEQVLSALKAQSDVADAWLEEEGNISFETTDGRSSMIVFHTEEAAADEETDHETIERQVGEMMAESSQQFSQFAVMPDSSGEEKPEYSVMSNTANEEQIKLFERDLSFNSVAIDPDVLVICPRESSDRKLKYGSILFTEYGRKLAEVLNGKCAVYSEKEDPLASAKCLIQEDLTQYGFVFLTTHGVKQERKDGSTMVLLGIYSSKDAAKANAAMRQIETWLKESGADAYTTVYRNDDYNYEINLDFPFKLITQYYISNGDFKLFTKSYDIVVSTDWFMAKYADTVFPNTLFIFDACESFNDAQFQQFLTDRGVVCYMGHKDEVNIDIGNSTKTVFLARLSETKTGLSGNSNAWRSGTIKESNTFAGIQIFEGHGNDEYSFVGAGSLALTVVDQYGQPIEGATVEAFRYWDGRMQKVSGAKTDPTGRTIFQSLPWGEYLFQAECKGAVGYISVPFAEPVKDGLQIYLNIETAKEPGRDMKTSITEDDIVDFTTQPRSRIMEQFGTPDQDDPDMLRYENILFNGNDGHLRFFYEENTLTCISWTSYVASRELFDELLAYFRTLGPDGEARYPQEGQYEQSVIYRDIPIFTGYEDTANGEYTYVFWTNW